MSIVELEPAKPAVKQVICDSCHAPIHDKRWCRVLRADVTSYDDDPEVYSKLDIHEACWHRFLS